MNIAGRLLGKQIINLVLYNINNLKITVFINNIYIYIYENNRSVTVTVGVQGGGEGGEAN